MAVSDRIAVMSGGVIQHVGTPKNIYQRPANLFVATFIGRSNILDGRIVEVGEGKATVELPTGYRVTFENLSPAYCKPQQVKLWRPPGRADCGNGGYRRAARRD